MHESSAGGSPPPFSHRGKPYRAGTATLRSRTAYSRPLLGLLLLTGLTCPNVHALELRASPDHSTTGTFTLNWQGPPGADYRLLQLDEDGNTRLIYLGRDTARVMTGLGNGDYRYRVETAVEASELVRVSVAHHSLLRTFSFFGVGLTVFLATVALVVRGEGRTRA